MGIMLYESLAGFPPFDGADSFSVGYKQVHEKPVPLDQVNKITPAALSSIVMHCLEKNPAERYARAFDLADALIAFLASAPTAREQHRMSRTARLAKGA